MRKKKVLEEYKKITSKKLSMAVTIDESFFELAVDSLDLFTFIFYI